MKNNKNKSIGKIGVAKVDIIVNKSNCIFHKIELENDIGNDAFIEFISGDESTSFCIATQIKSGKSFVRTNGIETFIPTDKEHLIYWKNLNLPVAGLVYNPVNDTVYWIDIKDYISKNTDIIEKGPYNISIPTNNIFSAETFDSFFQHFTLYNTEMIDLKSFMIAVNNISEIGKVGLQYVGVKNLFTYHRNKHVTWFILFNFFRYCSDKHLRLYLINTISFIPGHGDIFWHKDNLIDEPVRIKAFELLRKIWGEAEIRLLLESINEEEGIQRGSIGQAIYAIVDRINGSEEILKKIAFDNSTDEESSYWAFIMYLNGFQYSHEKEDTFELIDEYLSKFHCSSYYDIIREIKLIINQYGEFSIY